MKQKTICDGRIIAFEDGQIHRISKGREVPAKPFLNKGGYQCVTYYDTSGKQCRAYVHRLIAIAFLPNPGNLPEVNHIDGNKQNNHISNLEWVTYQENTMHAIRTGLMYPNHNVSMCVQRKNHYAKSNDGICYLCKLKNRKKAAPDSNRGGKAPNLMTVPIGLIERLYH